MHRCLPLLHIVFTNTHMPKHTEKHTPLLWSHHKQSFKHIFFQNITSCSVQLWEVIITFIDVIELSVSTFEYSRALLYFHPISFLHAAKGIQMNFSLNVAEKPVLALRLLRLSKFPLVLSWQANTQHFLLLRVAHLVDVFYPNCECMHFLHRWSC